MQLLLVIEPCNKHVLVPFSLVCIVISFEFVRTLVISRFLSSTSSDFIRHRVDTEGSLVTSLSWYVYVSTDISLAFMYSEMSFTKVDVSLSECVTKDLSLLSCVEDLIFVWWYKEYSMAVSGPPGRGYDPGVVLSASMSFHNCIEGSKYFSRKCRGI